MMTRYYTPDQCAGQIKSGKNGGAITRKTFLQNYATKAEFKAAIFSFKGGNFNPPTHTHTFAASFSVSSHF